MSATVIDLVPADTLRDWLAHHYCTDGRHNPRPAPCRWCIQSAEQVLADPKLRAFARTSYNDERPNR